jgi:hypothetical protein
MRWISKFIEPPVHCRSRCWGFDLPWHTLRAQPLSYDRGAPCWWTAGILLHLDQGLTILLAQSTFHIHSYGGGLAEEQSNNKTEIEFKAEFSVLVQTRQIVPPLFQVERSAGIIRRGLRWPRLGSYAVVDIEGGFITGLEILAKT